MEENAGKVVGASLLVWTGMYFASRALLPMCKTYSAWDRQRQYKARGLVPSSVFLLAIVPCSVLVLGWDTDLEHVRVSGATPWSQLICAVETGSFIYDSVVVLLHLRDDGLSYLFHGVLCMVRFPQLLCCLACVRGRGRAREELWTCNKSSCNKGSHSPMLPMRQHSCGSARAAVCGLAVLRQGC